MQEGGRQLVQGTRGEQGQESKCKGDMLSHKCLVTGIYVSKALTPEICEGALH